MGYSSIVKCNYALAREYKILYSKNFNKSIYLCLCSSSNVIKDHRLIPIGFKMRRSKLNSKFWNYNDKMVCINIFLASIIHVIKK